MKFNRNIKGNQAVKIDGKFQSRYFHDAKYVHDQLNKVSPSFCLAKWFNVSIHIPTGNTHSCYHPRSHHIPIEEVKIDVSALHNTRYKKEQRELMLLGFRPKECNFCWQIEDSGTELSDRAYRSKDVYEEGLIQEALDVGSTGNAKPRYVEVNFNQACNFKCTYCSPHLSTAWEQDIERNGPYKLSDRIHNDIRWMRQTIEINNSPDNPYLVAFWEWLPDIYPTLHTFRMTGGEPLMDKNTFRMFDYIKENPKEDLHLSITSNCCPPGDQWNKFMVGLKSITDIDAVDHFMLYCSLDSWGEQAEYIRDGLEFNTLHKNVIDFISNSKKHSLTFIVTFNALSYSGFNTLIEQVLKLRKQYSNDRQLVWFDVPQLMDPDYLNPKVIPEMATEVLKTLEFMKVNKETEYTQFKGFSDFEISKVQRLYDWIVSDTNFNIEKAKTNFYLFFSEYDRRNGKDFLTVFPQYQEFWKQCKDLNE
jgi:sulfatase maturation enzyme AslB (radical SAM superfamily)